MDFDYFEKILVKYAMLDSQYLASIADYVQPKYFDDKNIAKFFEIVADFHDKRGKLPTFTEVKTYLTTDELKNGFRKLVESFKEIDGNLDKDELYTNTEKFLKERGMYHSILESAEAISDGKADTSEIVEKFEKIAGINLNVDRGIELYGDVEKIIDDILNDEATISSKWPWLDDSLGGGFVESGRALYIFAGQSNIGKSIFLGNIAANIASQGKSVLIVTLEMSETLYAKRIVSNVTKIPMKDFRNNIPILRYALEEEHKNTDGRMYIKEFPPSTITPKQLGAFIKKMLDSGIKIDAVVVDYLTLLTSTGNNSYEKGKNICEQLRALTYLYKCPIISAVQIQRCLDVDTNVVGINGDKRIGDLKIGDKIMGKNGFVDVRYVYPKEYKRVYKITTKSGKEIICSKDHIFPTDNGIKSIEDGLTTGDMLLSAIQPKKML